MTRQEYLNAMRVALRGTPTAEIEDILRDFSEHFDIGLSQGKSEHEVSAELGDPATVAATYRDPELVTVGHTADEIPAAAAPKADPRTSSGKDLSYNDLTGPRVFVVLLNLLVTWWVAIAAYAVMLVLWLLSVGMIVGGIMTVVSALIAGITTTTALFAGIGLIFLGIAIVLFNVFLTKWLILGSKAYISWNRKVYHEGF